MQGIVLVATYNEAENISSLISSVREAAPSMRVLVVDDNSPDGTADIVRRFPDDGKVLLHVRRRNRGYGPSMLEGFRISMELSAPRVVTMDADFSHSPGDISKLVQASKRSDVVIGSRYTGGIRILNWQLKRLLLSVFANHYVRFLTGLPPSDCTSGFRCYSEAAIKEVLGRKDIRSNGYSFLVEILFHLFKSNYSIKEIPIVFSERREGKSKMNKKMMLEAALVPFALKIRRK
jgi:dolichol-phosphate mannosyltransferase